MSLRSVFILPVICGICAAPVLAQESGAPAAASSESQVKIAGYRLKKRSSFLSPDDQRPPFWPIGYSPKAAIPNAPVVRKVHLDSQWFAVSSILLGPPAIAVINGRPYGEGDLLKTPKAAAPTSGKDGKAMPVAAPANPSAQNPIPPNLRIRVARIGDGFVDLQCEDQSVRVALRRAEVGERKLVEDAVLLPPDERP